MAAMVALRSRRGGERQLEAFILSSCFARGKRKESMNPECLWQTSADVARIDPEYTIELQSGSSLIGLISDTDRVPRFRK